MSLVSSITPKSQVLPKPSKSNIIAKSRQPTASARSRGSKKNGAKATVFFNRLELREDQSTCPVNILRTLTQSRLQQDTYTMPFFIEFTASTGAGGTYNPVFANDPSGAANWAGASGLFDEYRVLAMEFMFRPNWSIGGAGTNYTPIAMCTDYNDATALTSYGVANEYSSCKEVSGNKKFNYTSFMSGIQVAGFISTAAPAASWWTKFVSTGNTASINLGEMLIKVVVQFRGKGN
jgi:hypothetical protein